MKVLVVGCGEGTLEHDAFQRVCQAAAGAGHEVSAIDLDEIGFSCAMSPAERAAYHEPEPIVTDVIAEHVAAVRATEALVFVYPTMASTVPPRLKGWLERVMLPGVAFVFDEKTERVRPGLRRVRRVLGVATYDEHRLRAELQADNGRRIILRALRLNTGFSTRTGWVGLYGRASATTAERDAFLAAAERKAATL